MCCLLGMGAGYVLTADGVQDGKEHADMHLRMQRAKLR